MAWGLGLLSELRHPRGSVLSGGCRAQVLQLQGHASAGGQGLGTSCSRVTWERSSFSPAVHLAELKTEFALGQKAEGDAPML